MAVCCGRGSRRGSYVEIPILPMQAWRTPAGHWYIGLTGERGLEQHIITSMIEQEMLTRKAMGTYWEPATMVDGQWVLNPLPSEVIHEADDIWNDDDYEDCG